MTFIPGHMPSTDPDFALLATISATLMSDHVNPAEPPLCGSSAG